MYLHAGMQQEMNDFLNDLNGLTDEVEEDSLSEHNESLLREKGKIQVVQLLSHHQLAC